MIEIIKNKHNISDNEVSEVITRVKVLLINSKNEILLGHSHLEYQFIGGHVEENENIEYALKRELKEETGLDFDTTGILPIGKRIAYFKDLPDLGKNRKIVIYYYEIFDDRIPNLKCTNYTEEEIDGNFSLRYVPLDILEEVITRNMEVCGDPSGIAGEMLEFLELYKK